MITITTSKGEFVVDEVDSSDIAIYMFFENPRTYRKGILLEPIFLISDVTEEDAKLVVDNYSDSKYKNYSEKQQDYPYFENPKYSLYSLLESKGIDINNGNWYLFKKI